MVTFPKYKTEKYLRLVNMHTRLAYAGPGARTTHGNFQ